MPGCGARKRKCANGCTAGKCTCRCGRFVLEVDKASYVKRPQPVHVEDLWRDGGGVWANVDGDAPTVANGAAGGDARASVDGDEAPAYTGAALK